ncbi:hypothetical protein J6590_071294 [Homalodisca vitripennis]|nr:hypothetical protein J6590_071294 [Homalodisca vitripennis]
MSLRHRTRSGIKDSHVPRARRQVAGRNGPLNEQVFPGNCTAVAVRMRGDGS